MALKIDGLLLDELTADPGSPVEGQMWFNTTESRFKLYRNGGIQSFSDLVELTNHTGDTANPHTTTLEQARTAGSTLAGPIDMGGNNITNLGGTGASYTAASQNWTTDQINQKLQGLDWQESVLDKDLVTAPGSPAVGDRYIIAGIGGAWSGGTIGDIAEWDGSAWVFSTPNEGFATRVMDENKQYIHDGASWGLWDATVDHGSLTGLTDLADHPGYLDLGGTRPMTGPLDMGTNAITNVGNVDGVDVSAHAARHIDGGADVVDGDKLEVTWTGHANYTPSTSPAEVDATDQLTAHLAGIDDALNDLGGSLKHKAGRALNASFTGNPKKATVTFAAAFADANYAVTCTAVCTNNKQFAPCAESQLAGSFVINLGSNNSTDLTQVNWVAVKDGESA